MISKQAASSPFTFVSRLTWTVTNPLETTRVTAQHSTGQHSAAQLNTAQHSTAQHSTAQQARVQLSEWQSMASCGLFLDQQAELQLTLSALAIAGKLGVRELRGHACQPAGEALEE